MARIYLLLLLFLVLFTALLLSFLPEKWWRRLLPGKKRQLILLRPERVALLRLSRNAFLLAGLFFIGTAASLILSDRFSAGFPREADPSIFFIFCFPLLTLVALFIGFYCLVRALRKPEKKMTSLPGWLAEAPGPTPWYNSSLPVSRISKKEELFWARVLLNKGASSPKIVLKNRMGAIYGILDEGVYLLQGRGSRFLIWDQRDPAPGEEGPMIRLRVIASDLLKPIDDLEGSLNELARSGLRAFFPGGETDSLEISARLPEGLYSREFPAGMREFGEIILFVPTQTRGGFWRRKHDLRLWLIQPEVGTIEVISQEWFNHGPYHPGTQIPLRAARNPATGQISCEGIRIGVFSLDDAKKNILDWIIQDKNYSPPGEALDAGKPLFAAQDPPQ